jgi:hypothetical protein
VGHIRLQDGNVGAFPEEAAVVLAADGGRVVDLYSGRRSPASAGRFFFMAFPFTRGRATRADETRAAASLNVAARFALPTFWFVAVNSLLILRNLRAKKRATDPSNVANVPKLEPRLKSCADSSTLLTRTLPSG